MTETGGEPCVTETQGHLAFGWPTTRGQLETSGFVLLKHKVMAVVDGQWEGGGSE